MEDVKKAYNVLGSASNKAKVLRNASRFEVFFDPPEEAEIAKALVEKFEKFLSSEGVEIVGCESASLESIVRRYFGQKPPFAIGAKKSEFPDAIALSTIEAWAKENKASVTVVSRDKGWIEFAEGSSHLKTADSVQEAIQSVLLKLENADYVLSVERAVESNLREIEKAIVEQIRRDFGYELVDKEGDVTDVSKFQLDHIAFSVTDFEKEEQTAKVVISGVLEFIADVQYDNTDNATWDSEEKRLIIWDQVNRKVEQAVDVEATVQITLLDSDALEIEEVHIEEPDRTISVRADDEYY